MKSSEACVRLQNSARRKAPTADESILKSSHRLRGKFAVFGHHHFLRRNCELHVVGDRRCVENKEVRPWRPDLFVFSPAPWRFMQAIYEASKRSVQRSGLRSRAIFLRNLFAFTREGPFALEWLCFFANILGNFVDLEVFQYVHTEFPCAGEIQVAIVV